MNRGGGRMKAGTVFHSFPSNRSQANDMREKDGSIGFTGAERMERKAY